MKPIFPTSFPPPPPEGNSEVAKEVAREVANTPLMFTCVYCAGGTSVAATRRSRGVDCTGAGFSVNRLVCGFSRVLTVRGT